MPFQVSPGVNVSEIDLTTVVPAVSTTEGALAGVYRWGPVDKRILLGSEDELAARFGKPTNLNAETFFTGANFLSYGNKLYNVRVGNTTPNTVGLTVASTEGANVTFSANVLALGVTTSSQIFHNNAYYNIDTIDAAGLVVTLAGSSTVADDNFIAGPAFVQDSTSLYTAYGAAANAIPANTAVLHEIIIKNDEHFDTKTFSASTVRFAARYPGELGNSLRVSVCDTSDCYFSNNILAANATGGSTGTLVTSSNAELTNISISTGSNTATVKIEKGTGTAANAGVRATALKNAVSAGDLIELGNTTVGTQLLKVTTLSSVTTNTTHAYFTINFDSNYTLGAYGSDLTGNVLSTSVGYLKRYWEYSTSVEKAPGTSTYMTTYGGNTSAVDEVHLIVQDEDGKISGVPGTVLEVFQGLSRATDAKSEDGSSLYYKDVFNTNSKYAYIVTERASGYSNTADNITSSLANTSPLTHSLVGGKDGANEAAVPLNILYTGYDKFKSAEDLDISLVLQGKARGSSTETSSSAANSTVTLGNYLIDNIAESRKDCVAFISPGKFCTVNNTAGDETDKLVGFRNAVRSTSYAVIDSGYKYQYDKYNDIYRYIPLNGDVAGLCVRTDEVRDPWWSPAGFNRGAIKNVVKLAFNPKKNERDIIYKAGINPVVAFPGQGTILFGDKTALNKPSAFDRINVRRLFIVLEKAVATAAKFTLFEFNDDFTRAQFRNLVEPFLRDVQGRRGIYDFRVVCDETNNTGEVIDRNEFVGDIYIKPAKSINFIQLNFVAVRTGVEFSEIVGQF